MKVVIYHCGQPSCVSTRRVAHEMGAKSSSLRFLVFGCNEHKSSFLADFGQSTSFETESDSMKHNAKLPLVATHIQMSAGRNRLAALPR